MSQEAESNPAASAPFPPSQADVLAENETLKARLSALESKVSAGTGPSTELSAAIERATAAEGEVARLKAELVRVEASLQDRAVRIACAQVASAGIVGKPRRVGDDDDNAEIEPVQNLTEKIKAEKAAMAAKSSV